MEKRLILGLILIAMAAFYGVKLMLEPLPQVVIDANEIPEKVVSTKKSTARKPANLTHLSKTQKIQSKALIQNKIQERYENDNLPIENTNEESTLISDSEPEPPSVGSTYSSRNSAPRMLEKPSLNKSAIPQESANVNQASQTFSSMNPIPSTSLPPTQVVTSNNSKSTASTNNSSNTTNFDCFASTSSGSFNHPLAITLSCNSSSAIRYCVSNGSCCDAESSPLVYSAPILIGLSTENVCISFVGENTEGDQSSIKSESYAMNITLPHLQVAQPKVFYQTTELAALTHITSNDFGKASHYAGVINLKEHDPSPMGLNMSCSDIINTYTELTGAEQVITPLATASLSTSDEIEVRKSTPKLSYGDNYITSYLRNSQGAQALDSCTTQKFVLSDFDFFSAVAIQESGATTSFKEFEGGFQSFGFFEPALPSRAPAGLNSDLQVDQSFEKNVFAWLY